MPILTTRKKRLHCPLLRNLWHGISEYALLDHRIGNLAEAGNVRA